MDNEVKILGILEQMQGRLDRIEEGQEELKENQKELQENQKVLQENQKGLQEAVALYRSMLARMEIEHGKKLQAIIDAQVGYEQTYMQHEPRIVKLETKVDQLDTEVRSIRAAR
jgi:chromosome segregation ATPase